MKSFKQFLAEETRLGTLNVFDVDDTLFHTTAKITVIGINGKPTKKLTNREYNTYVLKDNESFDFGEFKSAEKFAKESVPIRGMIAKAKAIIKNANKNPSSRNIILTARSDFDDRELFLQTLKDYGFDMNRIRVERAGNIGGPSAPAKVLIIKKYLDNNTVGEHFGKVRLFDDAESNLKAFVGLKEKYPEITFEAFLVKPDGSIRRYV